MSEPAEGAFGEAWGLALRHRFLVAGLPFLLAVAFVVWGATRPRSYTSAAAFMGASGEASGAGIANLASQFGFRLPTRDATQSPQFYADLLRSRQLLDSVVQTTYAYRDHDGVARQGTLVEAFQASGGPAVRVENARDALDRRASVGVSPETGVVRVSVSTEYPELSEAIVRRFLELTNNFNLVTRRSRAVAERRFSEERVHDAERELRASEGRLMDFQRENRSYEVSPSLTMEHDRLERDVMMRQQVYSTLMQSYEQARIEEVRDTPVITIVEPPYLPVRPDRRGLLRLALFGGVLGAVFGIAAAISVERWPSLRRRLSQHARA